MSYANNNNKHSPAIFKDGNLKVEMKTIHSAHPKMLWHQRFPDRSHSKAIMHVMMPFAYGKYVLNLGENLDSKTS